MRQFTYDFTSDHVSSWSQLLRKFRGSPEVHGLEIGCFEGRSSIWFLENILQHDTSLLTCIDPSFPLVFHHNISQFGEKVEFIEQKSELALRNQSLVFDSIHFVYIDGNHSSANVLQDAVLSFPLLIRGGVMIFDDYLWKSRSPNDARSMPRLAIDAFLSVFGDRLLLRHKGWQVAVERIR